MAIPKLIHYCWLSNDPWDEIHQKCFGSWKRLLPDYDFVLWDTLSEVKDIPFVKRMILQKSWAFAADYIRLYALYHYGGIYLDLDVKVLRNFDELLHHRCFMGREDGKTLACHIMGAVKKNEFIKENLDFYDTSFRLKIGQPPTMPRIVSKMAQRRGLGSNYQEIQSLEGEIVIYPAAYFCPLHYSNRLDSNTEQYISSESFCIHYWHHGWSWLASKSFYIHIVRQPWLFMNKSDFKRFVSHLLKLIKEKFSLD